MFMFEQLSSWLNVPSRRSIMANAALSVIRPVVRLGSGIAPKLAGRIAFDLFCRPGLAGGLDEKQKQAAAAAQKRLAAAERVTVTTGLGFVETWRFAAPAQGATGRTVLMVHGWTGRAAFMLGFVPALLKQAFDVVALDLPGHGASSGKRLNLAIAMDALAAVRRAHGPFHGILGHSFGGAIAVTAATGAVPSFAPLDVRRIAIVSSPDRMSTYFHAFGGALGLGRRAQAAMNDRVRHVAAATLDRFDGRLLLRESGKATLVVHDRDDREIPMADAESMAAAGPHVRLMATEGLGHRRILQSPMVAKAVAEHLAGG
jgi:pimeloyl-ACP methyl ester carboxylesterase